MDRLLKLAIMVALPLVVFFEQAYSKDLAPAEVYAKCYFSLTDHPVNMDGSNYKKIEKGELDPVDACMSVLDKADFVNKNGKSQISNVNDNIAAAIVRKFNSFHRSWFTSYGDFTSADGRHLSGMLDYDEPALFITDALFGEKHYKSIFTRSDSIQGVRKSLASSSTFVDGSRVDNRQLIAGPTVGSVNISGMSEADALKGLFKMSFTPIDTGYLVGVQPTPPLIFKQRLEHVLSGPYKDSDGSSNRDDGQEYDISQNFGGGLLGSSAYLYFNAEAGTRLDGGARVHRRMANNTFYDLMCLPLPNLKDSDLDAYVEKYKDSKLSFRVNRSCVGCHATLDPFADTFRNINFTTSANNTYLNNVRAKFPSTFGQAATFTYFKKYKVRTNEQVLSDLDNIYIRRKPEGHLFYRNYNGKLVNKTVNGITDMGNKIIEQDDVFMCAAQRYYQFLTGINVPVAVPENDDFYKKHRKIVVDLGKDLKSNGSLRILIKNILKTEAFQSMSPGLVGEKDGAQ